MNIASDVTALIGRTPARAAEPRDGGAPKGTQVLVKLESQNPANSVKDRIGLAMIEAAERDGLLARARR